MYKALVHKTKWFLLLFSLLVACTSGYRSGTNDLDLAIAPTPPLIAYENAEAYSAIAGCPWQSAKKIGQCSSNRIPLWTIDRTLRNCRPNRALAIGYPYDCGGSWHSWSYGSETGAAVAALDGCLNYLKGLEKHTGLRCGARLVLVNQTLLVNPEELPTKSRIPFIMDVKPLTGEEFSVYGMFESEGPGRNRRLEVFNDKGEKVCKGESSLSYIHAFLGSGDFDMNCFDGKLTGQGTLSVKRINLRHLSGETTVAIGKGRTSDGGEFEFLTGITIDQYETYKDLLK